MKKLLTLAACAALLAGCDFVGGSDVEPVAFSSLTITSAPLPADEDGSAPDIRVEIQDASGRTVYASPAVAEDADASIFPYTTGIAGELAGSSRSYFVVVMDRDADDYDLIAFSGAFSADALRAGSGSTFEVADEAGTLHAQFAITR